MKKSLCFLILSVWLGSTACNSPEKAESGSETANATPEEAGISSRSILQFVEALETAQPDAIHSFMLRRHGQVVASGWWGPYNPESPHLLWSLSKSFTSTAIGMAQDEGLLSIDDLVISFFPEEVPEEASANLKAMRIRDLLRMNTGHAVEPGFRQMQSDNWVEAFLAHKVDFKPGTHFLYNSMATYMCSAIIRKVTGMTTLDYLTPRLFEPLGIENPTWETCPRGISVGGWGLSVRTEDISKLGQLYLQKGIWEGRQLVSEAWVEEATGYQTSNGSNPESDWDQGYGYQFWQCRHNAYRGDGAFGQYCIVLPEQDAVLAMTSGSDDLQGILNVVWEELLPAMQEGILPPDEDGLKQLNQKLQELSISPVAGEKSSPLASEVSGLIYSLEPNQGSIRSISFNFEAPATEITIHTVQGESLLRVGYLETEPGVLADPRVVSDKVAASGAWTSGDTYVLKLIYYETPQSLTFSFRFEEDKLYWDTEYRASFGPVNPGQITGTATD
ncbi:MAG: serine hydrolase [Bacteroidales bacterium]|nr:serine hydrolase [Bacteroidales bacterium]